MAKEIERKFLIDQAKLARNPEGEILSISSIWQGYLVDHNNHVVRVRKESSQTQNEHKAYLTYKGPNKGIERTEVEVRIPMLLADILFAKCDKILHKTRKVLKARMDNTLWEIDYFHNLTGEYKDLIIAEVELEDTSEQVYAPNWLVGDVSHDPKYYNSSLIASIE